MSDAQPCKRGHAPSERNQYGHCRACARDWQWARNNPDGLVPSGMTRQQYADIRRHATRKARYGPSGASTAGRESWVTNMRRVAQTDQHGARVQRRRQTCRNGHPKTPANTTAWHYGGRLVRRCRLCRHESRHGRPAWVEHRGVRISIAAHDQYARRELTRLRTAMVAAHPDKGGTSAKFITARRALDQFLVRERAWYAAHACTPPREVAA